MDDNGLFPPQNSNNQSGQVQGAGASSQNQQPPVAPPQPASTVGLSSAPSATAQPSSGNPVVPQSGFQPQGVQQMVLTPQQPLQSQEAMQNAQNSSPQQNSIPQAPSDSSRITLEDLYGPSHAGSTATPLLPSQPTNLTNQPIPVQNTSQNPPVNTPSSQPILPPVPPQQADVQQDVQKLQGEVPVLETQPMERRAPQQPQVIAPNIQATSPKPLTSNTPLNAKTETVPPSGGGISSLLFKIIGVLVVILLVVVGIGLVSSLFKQNNSNEKVTLTYWGLWEDSNVFQGILNDFHRQNPNITVVYTKEDPVKYTDRLLTRIQNGNGPDIFRLHNTWIDPLQNLLLPLPADVIDTQNLQKNYFPVITKDIVRNGAVYGIPLQMDTLVMYTNKDIFDHAGAKIPTTWEDFVVVTKGLTVKDASGKIKTAGAAMGTYENITHAADIMSLLLLQNGADLKKLDGSQNAIDALNFYTSFSKTDDRVWDSTLDDSLTSFARGNVGIYFGYSYDYFAIKAQNPQLHFEVHTVPHLPGRDMSIASYWVEGVSSKSKHQKEALLFLKYLAQKDIMARLYSEEAKTRAFGEIYPRKDLASTLSTDPILAPFVAQSNAAVSSFFASNTDFVGYNDGLNRYLGNAINGVLKDTSADTAMGTVADGVSQIISQYANFSQ